ncbi:MAG: Gfo/Idh/MocA family oxidoreductase [Bacteroidales bacterium]|nr:Gfo/Idh/MocA family oxidoreductase [Bacteroidales bacterium]
MSCAHSDRREFLVAGATAAAVSAIPTAVHAKGADIIKVGLIGCGGRGSGAIGDSMSADPSIQLYAMGDVFEDVAKSRAKQYGDRFKNRVNLGDRVFSGLDAFKKVVDSGVDLVILATPPGFRPDHLEYAIKAKKHVFTEKPVAVDGPGIRKCLELVEEAKKNGKAVVAGTQRRHQKGYIETIDKIRSGAIGDIVSTRCSWNGTGIWFRQRMKDEADAHYQIRNWYHYIWMCGDHIVEQHVHNLDVINWIMGAHPVKATAIGARAYRPEGPPETAGQIWDHFAVEYEYPNGVPLYSYCAHIPGIRNDVSETVYGSKGFSQVNRYLINKEKAGQDTSVSPYVQEHIDMIQSIRSGKPLNELESVAHSTMTAILGREAAYSGKTLTWDQVLNAKTELKPTNLTLEASLKTAPVPLPAKYKIV